MSVSYPPSIQFDFNRPEFQILTPEEERSLGRAVQERECVDSRNRLVTSHMKLAMKIANGYNGRSRRDIQQEAFDGLIRAANKFDPEKGFRFATYALWWIRASVQDHIIKNHSMVKNGTTSDDKKLFFNFRKAENKLSHKNPEMIGFEFDVALSKTLGVSLEKVQQTRMRLMADASLDTPLSQDDESGGSWIDWLEDEDPQAAEINEERDHLDFAKRAFKTAVGSVLNDREKEILICRRLKEDPDTLEVLAVEHDISRERVRQIEMRALEKVVQYISTDCRIEVDFAALNSNRRKGRQSKIIRPRVLANA